MSIFLGGIGATNSIDKHLVGEVISFAENNQRAQSALTDVYLVNLQKKKKAGKYDSKLAVKLLEYYYQNYVRKQMQKDRGYGYDPKLNVAERRYFAEYFVDQLESEYNL